MNDSRRGGRRIAVVPCGSGELATALARAVPVATVAGFDPDPVAVAVARRAASVLGVADRVTFEVAGSLLGHGYDLVVAVVPRWWGGRRAAPPPGRGQADLRSASTFFQRSGSLL